MAPGPFVSPRAARAGGLQNAPKVRNRGAGRAGPRVLGALEPSEARHRGALPRPPQRAVGWHGRVGAVRTGVGLMPVAMWV